MTSPLLRGCTSPDRPRRLEVHLPRDHNANGAAGPVCPPTRPEMQPHPDRRSKRGSAAKHPAAESARASRPHPAPSAVPPAATLPPDAKKPPGAWWICAASRLGRPGLPRPSCLDRAEPASPPPPFQSLYCCSCSSDSGTSTVVGFTACPPTPPPTTHPPKNPTPPP